jgi:hypothetical protein
MTAAAFTVAVQGTGRVELAAYGVADAEHRVEKELAALWPDATVTVLEVGRTGTGRIVEELAVGYRVRGAVPVEAESDAGARRAALRELRGRFAGSRFERVAWEVASVAETEAGESR